MQPEPPSALKARRKYNNNHNNNSNAAFVGQGLKISPGSTASASACIAWILVLVCSLNGFEQVAALKGENPRIIEHPMDMTVPKNDPFTFNCKAEGNPMPSIQWFKDGHELKFDSGSHRIMLPAGGLFFLKVIHSRRESDAGTYYCQAKNEFGVARSRNATLQVAFLRDEFRMEPQNTRVPQGEVAVMECVAPRGSPEPQIFWRKNGQTMNLGGNNKRIRIVDGGNLAIQDARQSDDGRYQCVVRNVVGVRESATAFLKVHVRPFLIRGPQNQTAVVGSSVIFQCRIGGDPLPDVLWRRSASGGNMPLRRVHILEDRSLKLDNVTLEDMGEYSCEADNAVGSITATGILTVHAPPRFIIRPKNQLVEVGDEVLFECQATGYPRPTLYWSVEGNSSLLLPGYRDGRLEVTLTPEGRSVLSIVRFGREDSGKVVVCNALNAVGSVSSRTVVTVDTQFELPPPIIEQGPVNQTLPVTSIVTLPCRTLGSPLPQVSWYLDGIPVDVSDHERRNLSDAGALTIVDLQHNEDEGLYTCVASNRNGKSSWSGYLRVASPTNPNIKFFRAPELVTYPGPPGKPQVVEKTDDTVTISWTRSNKVGSSSLVGYVVEMFGKNETDGWVAVGARIQNTTFTQVGLVPGVNYFFIIRAENSHGLSLPSPISEPVSVGIKSFNSGLDLSEARASLLSGDVVELINASVVDSTSMKLTWQMINGKYVEGFYIYARQLPDAQASSTAAATSPNSNPLVASRIGSMSTAASGPASALIPSASKPNGSARRDSAAASASVSATVAAPTNANPNANALAGLGATTYRMLTILNGGGASSCTMTGLLQYTLYEFFMVPFYKSVEGKPSNSRVARTLEDVPNAAPFGMEAILLNSSAVFLKWRAPDLKAQHGVLLFYHVVVRGIDTAHNFSRILTNVTIDAASPTLVLANLTEGVMYTVGVAAGNNAGIGPYCAPATLRLDPLTKRLDPFINQRYPINQDHVDDVLTQPWFIILLGAILAIMMLSFGAMVFVKRKHMMMKQSALNTIRGSHPNDVLKMPSLSRNGNGFWLDASAGGMVWRTAPSGDALDMQKDQIADYAPVCLTNGGAGPDGRGGAERQQQRYVGEYSNIPTDYAEVSSFGKAPSEYGAASRTGTASPAPYATSSILGGGGGGPRYQQRPGNKEFGNNYQQQPQQQQHQPQQFQQQQQQPRAMHPHFQQQQQQQQHPHSVANIYQQMGTPSDAYPSHTAGGRSVYSEQYFYPKEQIHITENKLNNMLPSSGGPVAVSAANASNCHTFGGNASAPAATAAPGSLNSMETLRRSGQGSRFKIINTQPQNFQMHAAISTTNGTTTSLGDNSKQQQQQQQKQLNSQELLNTKNLLDLDSSSFCYNGMADSGCGGSPSPMAMLMLQQHGGDLDLDLDEEDPETRLYHTADGDDMERLYVKIDEGQQQRQPGPQQQQHRLQPPQLLPPNQVHPGGNGLDPQYWRSQPGRGSNSYGRQPVNNNGNNNSFIGNHHQHPMQAMNKNSSAASSSLGGSSSLSSCSENGLGEERHRNLQQLQMLSAVDHASDQLIYAPSSVASERSLLSNAGSGCSGSQVGQQQQPLQHQQQQQQPQHHV